MEIKKFFKDNWVLLVILSLALILRIYYYLITLGQPLWFDEGEYFSTSVHWAFGVPYEINPQRPPLFQLLAAISFMAGLGEGAVKLLFVIIPSVALCFSIYLLGKEMFNKNVGLIAAGLSACSWTFLFWSNRMQPDPASLFFQVMSVYFMWKYWNCKNKVEIESTEPKKFYKQSWFIWPALAGVCSALGFLFKVSGLLVPAVFLIYIFIKDGFGAIKDKGYWVYAFSFLLFLTPYLYWNFSYFGDPLAFKAGYIDAPTDFPDLGWYNLKFYTSLTSGGINNSNVILSLVFFMACAWAFIKLLTSLDYLVKDKSRRLDGSLFCLLIFIWVSFFYIVIMRNTDDRWCWLWMPFIFLIVGWALMDGYKYLEDTSGKKYMMVAIIGLVMVMMFVQYQHADELIKYKMDSYADVKDAGLWLKQVAPSNAKVLSISYPQTVYYSQRNVSTYSSIYNVTSWEEYISGHSPDYFIISIYEPHPQFIYEWAQNASIEGKITPVQGYGNPNPRLIIYKFNY